MRTPRRLALRLLWLASLAACASARPAYVVRPVNDGRLNPEWPELLRTRYGCEGAVVDAAQRAVRVGYTELARIPTIADQNKLVCDLPGELWPVRVRAFETASGIREQWEFLPNRYDARSAARASSFNGGTAQVRPAINSNIYQTYSVFLEGPTTRSLRVVRFSDP